MSVDLLEYRDKVLDAIGSAIVSSLDLIAIYPGIILVLMVSLLAISVVGIYRLSTSKKKARGIGTMAQRKAALERLYGDAIGEAFLNLLAEGKISKQEYRRDMQLFGLKTGLTDLLRRKRNPFAIRHTVLKNVEKMDNELEKVTPGVIPGPKPGEVIPPPVPDPPHRWITGGKFLARRKVA